VGLLLDSVEPDLITR